MGDVAKQPTPQRPPEQNYRFHFHDRGNSLAFVFLKNILLSVVTLGIYYPWAKTHIRQVLWRNSSFAEQRFVYLGTGKELFLGYLKVFFIFVGLSFLAAKIPLFRMVSFTVYLCLIPFAMIAVKRYLLSRTTWRGIRGGMRPVYKEFVWEYCKGGFLTVVTLGIYLPVLLNNLYRVQVNNAQFGTLKMKYNGKGSDVFWAHARYSSLAILSAIVIFGLGYLAGVRSFFMVAPFLVYGVIGLIYAHFFAWLLNYRFANTFIGAPNLGFAKGQGQFTMQGLFMLYLTNGLLLLFTFGLAFPWVLARTALHMLGHVSFRGRLDLDGIQQQRQEGRAIGDALANVLDVGMA